MARIASCWERKFRRLPGSHGTRCPRMRYSLLLVALIGLVAWATDSTAQDWITAPSYYSHDPQSGRRVSQYAPIGPFYQQTRPDYRSSGFWHTRSSIQAGGSSDNLHIVEEWGRPVRPYGEWRFPYRPYSVPYPMWGPQFYGFGFGQGFWPPLGPVAPHGQPGPYGRYPSSPSVEDGRYPPYRSGPRMPDRRFFRAPSTDDPSYTFPPVPTPLPQPAPAPMAGPVAMGS
jgi:hypothetical protein